MFWLNKQLELMPRPGYNLPLATISIKSAIKATNQYLLGWSKNPKKRKVKKPSFKLFESIIWANFKPNKSWKPLIKLRKKKQKTILKKLKLIITKKFFLSY